MASIKFKVVPFDGQNNFRLWRIMMQALLHRVGSVKTLDWNYPNDMTTIEIEDMEERMYSTIQLLLSDKVLHEILDEETILELWNKLESLYMKKSLPIRLF
ncbi:hypothetical protein EUGRSUZ_G01734 [Eucalyptus grandis]|uniref:Uncharacterized protein n=2 Tax=Eucalyptus grandis TaxID=71139 RepID=A0ACC3K6C3_EUCGR|nr:hypothetical protein EUGRSUZ_G01734 [Eucalyptus grandis]